MTRSTTVPTSPLLELQADEQELLMAVNKTWEEFQNEARTEGRRDALRHQLSCKFGVLPPEVEARIADASGEDLERFGERVLFANSLAAVFA